jgi:ElaB/YqjD/DUF883 family membrane-anchored ribosome-binding protein
MSHEIDPKTLARDFERLLPTLEQEWPEVPADELAATAGELEAVVDLVAGTTGHSKTLIRRQLFELHGLLETGNPVLDRMEELLGRLEGRARELADHELVDRGRELAEQRVKDNPLQSVLWALVAGLILGLFLGGRRGR